MTTPGRRSERGRNLGGEPDRGRYRDRDRGQGRLERWSALAERHQVALHFASVVAGLAVGLGIGSPAVNSAFEHVITPALAALLFVTFLGVPFGELRRSFADARFIGVLLAVNFAVAPALVLGLSRFVAHDPGLLLGVLLVLLTPCVDYVIVFTGLAGGDHRRLLAATPLLLLVQIALLPLWLTLMAGPDMLAVLDPAPFLEAFAWLIAIPLAAAALCRGIAGRSTAAEAVVARAGMTMVPLMMVVLLAVVAAQSLLIRDELASLAGLVPLYLGFAAVMTAVGVAAGRLSRLGTARSRALVFGGVTRNSLVVLPLALAVTPALGLAAPAVVMQTLVELVCMIVLVRIASRLVPEAPR